MGMILAGGSQGLWHGLSPTPGSACQILPSLSSHKTKAQSLGHAEQAAHKHPSSSSLLGTEAPCNETCCKT